MIALHIPAQVTGAGMLAETSWRERLFKGGRSQGRHKHQQSSWLSERRVLAMSMCRFQLQRYKAGFY